MSKELEGATVEKPQNRRLEIDWTETEWFAVWLRLARRDYHGQLAGEGTASRCEGPLIRREA